MRSTQFNIRNAGSKTFGTYISDDKTRSLTTGLTIDKANATGGSTFINTSFSQGFNILGARKSGGILLSRENGRSDFSKVETYCLTDKGCQSIKIWYKRMKEQQKQEVLCWLLIAKIYENAL